MADKKISDLTNNPSINGTEEIAEERGGSNYKNNLADVKTYVKDGLNTSEVTESTDKNYVTDAEKVVVGNTSGTNTGDETTATIQNKRPLKTVNLESLEGIGNITIEGGTITNGNGTTANGNAVDLGGVANANTEISLIDKEFKIIGTDDFIGNEVHEFSKIDGVLQMCYTDTDTVAQSLIKIVNSNNISIVSYSDKTNTYGSGISLSPSKTDITVKDATGFNRIRVDIGLGVKVITEDGLGFSFNDYTVDNANVGAWGTATNAVRSEAEIISNTVQHSVTGEPTGSDPVLNMVSLTQAEYDAGTPIATTLYVITD